MEGGGDTEQLPAVFATSQAGSIQGRPGATRGAARILFKRLFFRISAEGAHKMTAKEPARLRVKNWKEHQHYKDRSPPWIKRHRLILDDYDFARLPTAGKALAPLAWLLASESQTGEIDGDPGRLAFRLRWDEAEVVEGLTALILNGMLSLASGVLAPCLQHACREREREREAEGEGETDIPIPNGIGLSLIHI